MREEHITEPPPPFRVEPLPVKSAVVRPAQQQPNGLYQLVHFVGAYMGQLAVVFVKYLPYSPVHRDIDFLVRFLLGKQNELHPVYLGYHVLAYS